MALLAGTATTPDSLAKAIYDAVVATFGPETGQVDTDRQAFCEAIATAIISHFVAHGDVRVTTGDSGLQRDNTGGNPDTLAPSADVVLVGAIE